MKPANRIYFSIMHLYNKRKLFVLSALMILIGVIVCFKALSVYYIANYNLIGLHRLFGDRIQSLYKIENGYVSTEYEYYEKYRDFLLELQKDYDVNLFETTGISPADLLSGDLEQWIRQGFTEEELQEQGNGMHVTIPFLKIDNGLLYLADIRDEQNKVLELGTRLDGSMEVAVGSFYKGVVQIGDTFEDSYTGQKFVVAYFLSEGQQWVSREISDSANVVSLDKYFITSVDLQNYNYYSTTTYVNNVFLYLDEAVAEEEIAAIMEYADEEGIYIDIMSYEEYERSLRENNKMLFFFSFMLAVLILITVLVVSVIFSVVTWLLDYHDIGILYANGFLRKDIFLIILQENLLKVFLPVLVSYAYISLFEGGIGLTTAYIHEVFLIVVLIYITIMVLCSVGSYYFINRYVPVQLLKGEGM